MSLMIPFIVNCLVAKNFHVMFLINFHVTDLNMVVDGV